MRYNVLLFMHMRGLGLMRRPVHIRLVVQNRQIKMDKI